MRKQAWKTVSGTAQEGNARRPKNAKRANNMLKHIGIYNQRITRTRGALMCLIMPLL
jgi:hypothetical protein